MDKPLRYHYYFNTGHFWKDEQLELACLSIFVQPFPRHIHFAFVILLSTLTHSPKRFVSRAPIQNAHVAHCFQLAGYCCDIIFPPFVFTPFIIAYALPLVNV